MIGVITNALAIAIMAILGKFIGNRIPTRVQEQVLLVLPLSVMIMGIQMALKAHEFIIVMMSLAIGTGIGAAMDIDGAFNRFGEKIDSRLAARSGGEVTGEGPMTAAIQASILFCVGSMAIIGAIEAGMNGSTETFMIKSVLDGMTSLVFGSTLGIGVALSAIPVFLYEGALVLMSGFLEPFISDVLLADLTSVGGIMILAIGFGILEIKDLKVANMLPAFVVVIVIHGFVGFFM
ncbi:DUF554 domain-containing protein [Peptoniphilus sp. EMRHCC_23]|uniref:DUF554 domain-containing protein n=1 Tax=Peptoniphilus rachelemmaiella TaxID=2811779 RepID=UPI001C007E4C|nr:DUF554 domain-containing protein [Peptoniphilus rachelemmaiella]